MRDEFGLGNTRTWEKPWKEGERLKSQKLQDLEAED